MLHQPITPAIDTAARRMEVSVAQPNHPNDVSLTQLLASVGINHKPHAQHGCRDLYRGSERLGPHTYNEAYALYQRLAA